MLDELKAEIVRTAREMVPALLAGNWVAQAAAWVKLGELCDETCGAMEIGDEFGMTAARLHEAGRDASDQRRLARDVVVEVASRAHSASTLAAREMSRPSPYRLPADDILEAAGRPERPVVEVDPVTCNPMVATPTAAGWIVASPSMDKDVGIGVQAYVRDPRDDPMQEPFAAALLEYSELSCEVRTIAWDETRRPVAVPYLEVTPVADVTAPVDATLDDDGIPNAVREVLERHAHSVWPSIEPTGPLVEVALMTPSGLGEMIANFDFRNGRDMTTLEGWAAEAREVHDCFDPDYQYSIDVDDMGRPPAGYATGADLMSDLTAYKDAVLGRMCAELQRLPDIHRSQSEGRDGDHERHAVGHVAR